MPRIGRTPAIMEDDQLNRNGLTSAGGTYGVNLK